MYRVKPISSVKRSLAFRAVRRFLRVFCDAKRRRIARVIVDAPPAPPTDESLTFTTHMLLCKRDLDMAICAAKACDLATDLALRWVFHDDGTLGPEDMAELERQFPGAKAVSRSEGDQRAAEMLKDCPRTLAWRENQLMVLKMLDVAFWAGGERTWYVDSDIVMFQHPKEILALLGTAPGANAFNRDMFSSYAVPVQEIRKATEIKTLERVNAGLWVMNTDDIKPEVIEQWLAMATFQSRIDEWVLDQTFIAMLASASPHGVEHLPEAYDVSFRKDPVTSVCKHYVGRIRHGFELEGLRYLIEEFGFIRRWERFLGIL